MTVHAISPLVKKRPADATHVWGVDTSATKGAAIAVYNVFTDEFQTNTVAWPNPKANPGLRLMECRRSTQMFAANLSTYFPPIAIGVERPTGRHHNPPLDHHAGVIAEAVGAGSGMPAHFIAVKEWRALCDGLNGNSDKAAVVAWAKGMGWKFTTEDEAEALGVAFAVAQQYRARLVA